MFRLRLNAKWVGIGLAVAALLLVFNAAWELETGQRVIRAQRAVATCSERRLEVAKLLSSLQDAETGQRGFVITASENFLEPYRAALGNVDERLHALDELAEPKQRADVQLVRVLSRARVEELRETVALVQNGPNPTEGAARARAMVATERGKRIMDDLRRALADLDEGDRVLLVALEHELTAAHEFDDFSTLASVVCGMVFILFSGVLVLRSVRADQRAATRLQQQKDLLESVVTHAPGAIALLGQGGPVVLSNPAYRELWPGQNVAEDLRPVLERVLRTGSPESQVDMPLHAPGPSSTTRYVCWFCSRLRHPDRDDWCLLFTAFESTERKQAEDGLRENEARLRLLIDHAPAALAILDRDLCYLGTSARWRRDYHVGDRDLTGLSHYTVFPEITAAWKRVHQRALAGEVLQNEGDRFERADGVAQWIRWEVRPWHTAGGEIGGIVIFSEDITAQMSLESARDRAIEQLRHHDRVAMVGTLAAGFAHEIGTPLSIVAGHAEMIAAREVTDDAAIASANTIRTQAQRMASIVRELLSFARRSRGELNREAGTATSSLAGETVDVGSVVQRTVTLLASNARAAKVTLRDAIEVNAPLRARATEQGCTQIVMNLVINAIHACAAGGNVLVSVKRAASEPGTGGFVRVDVADTGTGIPDHVRQHMFEPFFTTKSAGEGTGLGLAIVQGIVQENGGHVDVTSVAERGTTFSVFLPQAPALSDAPSGAADP